MNHRHVTRLNRSWTEASTGSTAAATVVNSSRGASMPPINRGSMPARPWRGFLGGVLDGWIALATRLAGSQDPQRVSFDEEAPAPANATATAAWKQAASHRRRALLTLIALSVVTASVMLDHVLPN